MSLSTAPTVRAGLVVLFLISVPGHLWLGFPEYARSDYLRPLYALICPVIGCELPYLKDTSLVDVLDLQVRYAEERQQALVLEFSLMNKANYLNSFPRCRLVFVDLDGSELSDLEFDPRLFSVGGPFPLGLLPVGIPIRIAVPLEEPSLKAVNYELVLM